jgi:hypothetical protein
MWGKASRIPVHSAEGECPALSLCSKEESFWYRHVEPYTVDTVVNNSITFHSVSSREDRGKDREITFPLRAHFTHCLEKATLKTAIVHSLGIFVLIKDIWVSTSRLKHLHISQGPLISILFSAKGWKCSDLALTEGSRINNGELKKRYYFQYILFWDRKPRRCFEKCLMQEHKIQK